MRVIGFSKWGCQRSNHRRAKSFTICKNEHVSLFHNEIGRLIFAIGAYANFFLKHRAQDFEYLFNGIITVMEQQTEIVKYILPGAKKSLPYVTETSEPGAISRTL